MSGTFFCNKCGAQNPEGAQFCGSCGAPTNPAGGGSAVPAAAVPYGNPAVPYMAVMPAVGVGYGGFWIRLVAAIIDTVILRIVVVPVQLILGSLGLAGSLAGTTSGIPLHGLAVLGGGVTIVALTFGSWLYEALMESSSYQATLGKMILGMKVTDLYGNRISFGRATGRHFAKILSTLVFCIGYLMVGFTERKQGLHDLLAGTLVRRG